MARIFGNLFHMQLKKTEKNLYLNIWGPILCDFINEEGEKSIFEQSKTCFIFYLKEDCEFEFCKKGNAGGIADFIDWIFFIF